MTLKHLFPLLMAGVIGLSACDKPAPTADTPPASDTKTTQAPTTPSTNAYLDYQIKLNRTLVAITLSQDYELTELQITCLLSNDSTANYLSVLEPHFKKILSEEDFKEADEFFASETGQKFSTIIDGQLETLLRGETNTSTDEQKAIIDEAIDKPFFTKSEAHANQMSEREALAFLHSMTDKEMARCGIESTQEAIQPN